jgi:small subunit ribosomal protein S2
MASTNYKELLEAGVHFGHLKRKWNPNMAPYIFMERNGIHVIDLHKTVVKCDEAAAAIKQIAKSGKKILVVATKKQAKNIVERQMQGVNMPYVTERWPGGMLTNFVTIRKAIRKMTDIDKMKQDGRFMTMSKRERLQVDRQREKLEKDLGSISDLTRLPAALFIIDVNKEHIAVREARKLNIPTFAIVDTNADPKAVDFPIPGNDDASAAIDKILGIMTDAMKEGLAERKTDKDKASKEAEAAKEVEAAKAADDAKAAEEAKTAEAPAEKKAEETPAK